MLFAQRHDFRVARSLATAICITLLVGLQGWGQVRAAINVDVSSGPPAVNPAARNQQVLWILMAVVDATELAKNELEFVSAEFKWKAELEGANQTNTATLVFDPGATRPGHLVALSNSTVIRSKVSLRGVFPTLGIKTINVSVSSSIIGKKQDGTNVTLIGEGSTNVSVRVEAIDIALAVIEGATRENVTGAMNWAAVRTAGNVIIEATIVPHNPPQQIVWNGGEPIPGQPHRRKVSKLVSNKTTVTATYGQLAPSLDIWIIWASTEIQTSGLVPAPDLSFPNNPIRGLGPIRMDENGYNGRMCFIAHVTPANVHQVLQSNWRPRQQKQLHDKKDGQHVLGRWSNDWLADGPTIGNFTDKLDNMDMAYSIDGPNIGPMFGAQNEVERTDNFRNWLEWNGQECSEKTPWHWHAVWQRQNDMSVFGILDVGPNPIPIPKN